MNQYYRESVLTALGGRGPLIGGLAEQTLPELLASESTAAQSRAAMLLGLCLSAPFVVLLGAQLRTLRPWPRRLTAVAVVIAYTALLSVVQRGPWVLWLSPAGILMGSVVLRRLLTSSRSGPAVPGRL